MDKKRPVSDVITLFDSEFGWMALVGRGDAVRRLAFGYPSPDEALASLPPSELSQARVGRWNPRLVARLRAYARGARDDFRDVKLDLGPRTEFQRRVIAGCRRIRYAQTSTYSELAIAARHPRAARAVGSVMSSNAVPLIVPCHRVLAAGRKLGGYSCPLGLQMKTRLLKLEAAGDAHAARLTTRRQRVAAGAAE